MISTAKLTLQAGTASAIGMPIPEGMKVGTSSPSEPAAQEQVESERKTSTSPQQRKVIFASETEAVQKLEKTAQSEMNLPSSWSLQNTNEIVILALQIGLTQKFEKCFGEMQSGDKDSLERMQQHLSAILSSAAGLLQGANACDRVQEVFTDKPFEADINDNEMSPENERDSQGSDETRPEVKVLLSPSQIQKLSNLVFILSSKRDLAVRLSELVKSRGPKRSVECANELPNSFEWQSQLKYSWSDPNATCNVTVLDYSCEYGFEYQGTAARIVSTLETEKAMFWMTQGMLSFSPCLVLGPKVRERHFVFVIQTQHGTRDEKRSSIMNFMNSAPTIN